MRCMIARRDMELSQLRAALTIANHHINLLEHCVYLYREWSWMVNIHSRRPRRLAHGVKRQAQLLWRHLSEAVYRVARHGGLRQ